MRISFSVFFISIVSFGFSQSEDELLLNKEYNQLLYTYRQIWQHLDRYTVASIYVYDTFDNEIMTIKLDSNKGQTRDSVMNLFMKTFYYQDKKLNKVKIGKRIIQVKDCDIKIDTNIKLLSSLNDHASYCDSSNILKHEQGNLDLDGRLNKFDIDVESLAENCSRTVIDETDYQNLKHVFIAYWRNRHKTAHFNVSMMHWKYVTTAFSKDSTHFYSVTSFTNNLVE